MTGLFGGLGLLAGSFFRFIVAYCSSLFGVFEFPLLLLCSLYWWVDSGWVAMFSDGFSFDLGLLCLCGGMI